MTAGADAIVALQDQDAGGAREELAAGSRRRHQLGRELDTNYAAYVDFLVKNGVLKQSVPATDLITNELIGDINKFDAAPIAAIAKNYK